MISASDWTVVAVTTLVVGLAVFLHFEVIAALNRWTRTRPIDKQRDHHDRPTLLIVISVLLGTHIAEIWLFGGAFWLLINIPLDSSAKCNTSGKGGVLWGFTIDTWARRNGARSWR
ncbi:hypothetical protein [Algiphilus aromaticivorans]|uniref:hypothetical protein n=1 Tax=Algiphilus aromaticivorans TaxID=382454 RepID=UPI000693C9ED|nr:hypothetical protein [Algiphilus aromaticivorans]